MKHGFILFFQKYHKYFKTRQPVVSSFGVKYQPTGNIEILKKALEHLIKNNY